jgi:hypothetical protein
MQRQLKGSEPGASDAEDDGNEGYQKTYTGKQRNRHERVTIEFPAIEFLGRRFRRGQSCREASRFRHIELSNSLVLKNPAPPKVFASATKVQCGYGFPKITGQRKSA